MTTATKLLIVPLLAAILVGCASNPMLTGKPQDWKGKPSADLLAGWGKPARILPQSDGSEIWEYVEAGEFVAPAEESTSFRMGGMGGQSYFGASGGINTVKERERLSKYENRCRFEVKNGKVRKWFAERVVDGRVVWQDH